MSSRMEMTQKYFADKYGPMLLHLNEDNNYVYMGSMIEAYVEVTQPVDYSKRVATMSEIINSGRTIGIYVHYDGDKCQWWSDEPNHPWGS